MKNKVLYAFIFAMSSLFLDISSVNAEDYNLKYEDYVDSSNYTVELVSEQPQNYTNTYRICRKSDGVCNEFTPSGVMTLLNFKNKSQILRGIDHIFWTDYNGNLYYDIFYKELIWGTDVYQLNDVHDYSDFYLHTSDIYPNDFSIFRYTPLVEEYAEPIGSFPTNDSWGFKYSFSQNKTIDNMPWGATVIDDGKLNHRILYATFDLYNYNSDINGASTNIFRKSDYEAIPEIDVSTSITKQKNGSYNVGFNVIPYKANWVIEIQNLETGRTVDYSSDKDLRVNSALYTDVVSNTLFRVKIYKNSDKDVLYYDKTFDIILDEDLPHIVVNNFEEIDKGFSLSYYFKNTNSKNSCYYSTQDLEWIELDCKAYSDSSPYKIDIFNNGLYGIKITNNVTNEIIDQYSLNLIIDRGALYMEFANAFRPTTLSANLYYEVFNYEENQRLYYSTDEINWKYLEKWEDSIEFYYPANVYFKIEDPNGNIVYKTFYKLTFNGDGDYSVTDTDSFISNFSGIIGEFLGAFMQFYNSLNSTIRTAIVTILSGIILCIFIERWRKD